MNTQVMDLSGKQTMSSFEFREYINAERVAHGENKVENSHFLKRIEDELEGELGIRKLFVNPEGGRPAAYYDLTLKQCFLVGMRESKSVRLKVYDMVESLKNIAHQAHQQLLLDNNKELEEQRDEAIRTKAYIGSKREATAMNTARQANKRTALAIEQISVVSEQRDAALIELDQSKQWSTIKRMEIATGNKFNWRTLKAVGSSLGVSAKDVYDPIYNTVKSYHAAVWEEAYGLDISKL